MRKLFFLCFLSTIIIFSSGISYADAKSAGIFEEYLKRGGYTNYDIRELLINLSKGKITREELGMRVKLSAIGYSQKEQETILGENLTIKELENMFLLKELGYDQKTIWVIIITVRELKKEATLALKKESSPTFFSMEKRIQDVFPIIREAALAHDIQQALILAVIHQESRFVTRAISSEGAKGLMQLMPGTAKDLGVRNPFDPKDNIMGGTKYLRQLMDIFEDDLDLVLAAYNSGPSRVAKLGRIPKIAETVDYVTRVKTYYAQYTEKYAQAG